MVTWRYENFSSIVQFLRVSSMYYPLYIFIILLTFIRLCKHRRHFFYTYETWKPCFIVLRTLNLYHKVYKKAKTTYYTVIKQSGYLRTLLEKCRKYLPAARVF